MAKILSFRQRTEEDKNILRRLNSLFYEVNHKVTRLIPRDVARKLELPDVNGEEMKCFRHFVNYFALKKYDEDDELHEFFNKIDIAFLTPEEYDIFKEFYGKDFDWDEYLSTMIAYENSAVNMYRSCQGGRNKKIVAYARTKYYFSKMMLYLFEERVEILN